MRTTKFWTVALIAAAVIISITFLLFRLMMDISAPYPTDIPHPPIAETVRDTVNIGVVSRFPANVLYQGYQPLLDYLIDETGFHFELIISPSYSEAVMQIADGTVHAAFLGSYIYYISKNEFQLVPILKPLNEDGEPFFQSVIIVQEDSDITRLEDLSGRTLALPSEQSYSGNWLDYHDWSPASPPAIKTYFQNHHHVVYEIMRGNFDAGSVKDRVSDEFSDRGIRVIARSEPVPGSPLVTSTDADVHITQAIKKALLDINPSNPEHAEMIQHWDPEFAFGFSEARPEDYDLLLPEKMDSQ